MVVCHMARGLVRALVFPVHVRAFWVESAFGIEEGQHA